MTLRKAMLLGMGAVLLAVLLGTAASVMVVVDRSARREAADDLQRSRRVFEDLNGYRKALFDREVHVVAEEPRLKAVVASEETTPETVFGVLVELRDAIRADVLLITDETGHIIADAADAEASGRSLATSPVIQQALTDGHAQAVWTGEDGAVQVSARRLAFGSTVVGVLVIGHRLDDALARTVQEQTGSALAVLLDGRVIAASSFPGRLDADRAALAKALSQTPVGQTTPAQTLLADETFLTLSGDYPGAQADARLHYVVARSLDEAVATGRRLLMVVGLVLLIVGLGAAVFAGSLSQRLAKPIADMVQFARNIAGGELQARAEVRGPVEIQALGNALNHMAGELDESRKQLAIKERLEQEMEIATRLQTSILPRRFDVENLNIAARMLPATEVGGDYYDVIPVKGGAWLGVGDVAGHGLSAGVIMLMIQNLVSALVKALPTAAPSELLSMLNEVLYENVRQRLERTEHTTLTLLRYASDGKVTYAGAHEVALVCRARGGRCEQLANPGTWVGAMRDVRRFTVDTEVQLEPGDVMVLYTDGLTEAADARREQFGVERLAQIVEASRERSVDEIRDLIFDAVQGWTSERVDDMTVLVLRYTAARQNAAAV